MVDSLWPVDAVAGSPNYSGRMLRQAGSAVFAGATALRPLGARSGVRPGTSTSTVTATPTTWSCGPFAGVIDLEAAAEAGPYTFAFDAVAGGALDAADATYARRDLVYVQVDDPAEGDGSTVPAITRKYVAGTPSASPVDASLPVSRAFAIARINVPKAGGGSPTVTWIAPYAVAAGAPIPVWSKAEGDLLPSIPGLERKRLDKGRIETYYDTTTKSVAGWYQTGGNPEVGTFTYSTSWTDYSTGKTTVVKNNGQVTLNIRAGGPAPAWAGLILGTLPVGFRIRADENPTIFAGADNNNVAPAVFIIRATGVVELYPTGTPISAFGSVTFTAADTPVAD